MKPIKFPEANTELTAPKGLSNCQNLPVLKSAGYIVSCWELDEEDLKQIMNTKKVYLGVRTLDTHPPLFLSAEFPMMMIYPGDIIKFGPGVYREALEFGEQNGFRLGQPHELTGETDAKVIGFDELHTRFIVELSGMHLIIPNESVKEKVI